MRTQQMWTPRARNHLKCREENADAGPRRRHEQRLQHATRRRSRRRRSNTKTGKDSVLHAETNSGKTLAYASPSKKRVLVLTPSTSLGTDHEVVDQFTETFAVHTPKEVLKAEEDLDSIDVIVLDEVDALLRAPGRYAAAGRRSIGGKGPRRRYCDVSYRGGRARKLLQRRRPVGPLRRHIDDILRDAAPSKPRPHRRGHRAANQWKSGDAPSHSPYQVSGTGPRGGPRCLGTALDALNAARPLVVVNDGDPDRVSRFLKSGAMILMCWRRTRSGPRLAWRRRR